MSFIAPGSWISRFLAELGHHTSAATSTAVGAPLAVAPVLAPVPPAPEGGLITARLLLRLGAHEPDAWAGPIAAACAANEITTPLRVAAFLANILNETGGLTTLSEGLSYTPTALLKQWPSHSTAADANRLGRTAQHPADEKGIAELAYGGRGGNRAPGSGDGYLFRGHGCLQTTFRGNYVAFGKQIGWTRPVEELPAYLMTKAGAADSATVFWKQARCNVPADAGDITAVRRIVNGGSIGLVPVKARYAAARVAFGI